MRTRVASVYDIPDDDAITITLEEGKELLLCKLEGKVYGLSNVCPHMGGPLGEGEISKGEVTCPWHGWRFDLKTGQCKSSPAECLDMYKIEIDGTDIFILEEDV